MDMRNNCDWIVGTRLDFRGADIYCGAGLRLTSFALTGHRICHLSHSHFSVSSRLLCHLSLLYTSCAFCYCGITMQSFHCMATWEHIRYRTVVTDRLARQLTDLWCWSVMKLLYSHHLANSQQSRRIAEQSRARGRLYVKTGSCCW